MAAEPHEAGPERQSSVVRFAEFELDLRTAELRKRGLRLRLQEQSFQVLAMLVARPGELVTREELRQKLWPDDTVVDFDHGLSAAVNKLREALSDSASAPRFIETLPKRGYRFLFPLSVFPSADIADPRAEDIDTPAVGSLPRPSRALSRSLFALAQAMYLAFYIAALANAPRLDEAAAGIFGRLSTAVGHGAVITAIIGIPARLYLLSATAFDVRALGEQFRRLFPALILWAARWAPYSLLLWRQSG